MADRGDTALRRVGGLAAPSTGEPGRERTRPSSPSGKRSLVTMPADELALDRAQLADPTVALPAATLAVPRERVWRRDRARRFGWCWPIDHDAVVSPRCEAEDALVVLVEPIVLGLVREDARPRLRRDGMSLHLGRCSHEHFLSLGVRGHDTSGLTSLSHRRQATGSPKCGSGSIASRRYRVVGAGYLPDQEANI